MERRNKSCHLRHYRSFVIFGKMEHRQTLFSLNLGSAPSPFPYLLPINAEAFHCQVKTCTYFYLLPFIYVGIVLTIKRLYSLNWLLYSSILFFIPFINLLFFCLLSILPKAEKDLNSKANKAWLDRIIPRKSFLCRPFGEFKWYPRNPNHLISLSLGLVRIMGGVFLLVYHLQWDWPQL